MEELRFVDCQNWDCQYVVTVSAAALESCFGWDDQNNEWLSPPPGDLGLCDPTQQSDCTHIEVYGPDGNFAFKDACGCQHLGGATATENTAPCCTEGALGDDASMCCYAANEVGPLLDAMEDWYGQNYPNDVSDDLLTECGLQVAPEAVCEPEGVVGPNELADFQGVECDFAGFAESFGGSHELLVDPALSYVMLGVTGAGQDTVPLTGFGVANSAGTPAFLFGVVDTVGSGTLGSDVYDQWRFWFTEDILLNVQTGSFSIPPGQAYAFNGRGLDNGTWASGVFEPLATATGHFYPSTWVLDYHVTTTQGFVTVHLEGPAYGLSSP